MPLNGVNGRSPNPGGRYGIGQSLSFSSLANASPCKLWHSWILQLIFLSHLVPFPPMYLWRELNVRVLIFSATFGMDFSHFYLQLNISRYMWNYIIHLKYTCKLVLPYFRHCWRLNMSIPSKCFCFLTKRLNWVSLILSYVLQAYMEPKVGKLLVHICIVYIAKSNLVSKEKDVILLNQECVSAWNF